MAHKTILVVEDELMIAEDIIQSLSSAGYHVPFSVPSGLEAIAKVKECQPDLVLMDILLKGDLDGIETAQEIRQIHDCAIIFLTAFTDQKMFQRAKVASPYGYLLKPFRERELQAMVEISLHRHEMQKQDQAKYDLFLNTLLNTQDAILVTDTNGKIQFSNPASEKLLAYQTQPLHSLLLTDILLWDKNTSFEDWLKSSATDHCHLKNKQGQTIAAKKTKLHLSDSHSLSYVWNLYFQESESISSGPGSLISICASCKNIRNEDGHYIPFETFFRDKYSSRFTHGICPGCFETLYPEYFKSNQF